MEAIFSLLKVITPLDGEISLLSNLRSVLLPEPEGPIIPVIPEFVRLKDILDKIIVSPIANETSCIENKHSCVISLMDYKE
jgi:hypothetical protein